MSQDLGTRFRKRITPPPGGGASKFTYSFAIQKNNRSNEYVTYIKSSDPISGWPYVKAESTWDDIHPGPPFNSGGPFRSLKFSFIDPYGASYQGTYYTNSQSYVVTPFGSGRQRYIGGFLPPGDWPNIGEVVNLNLILGTNSPWIPDLSDLDGAAWDKTKPRIEQGGLFVALAELKDVPKMLQTTAKLFDTAWHVSRGLASSHEIGKSLRRGADALSPIMKPKEAANHFLNHNFGWVPFVKDVSAFVDNIVNVREKIGRLKNENGKWVRRRAVLVNNVDDLQVPGWKGTGIHNVYPLNTDPLNDTYVGTPNWEYRHRIWDHAESVGMFRYYLPYFDVNSPEWKGLGAIRRQLALHGARISPSNLYKAIPWTWLIDWITPTGHNLQVANDEFLDQMAAKYLYVTHRKSQTLTFNQFVPFNGMSGGHRTLSWTRQVDFKNRKEAGSPYGFGLTWDQLSPKQLAILAALGISRK